MPPAGYLSAGGVEASVQYIVANFPSFTQLIVLPETSVDGKTIRAVKIAKGNGDQRRGILFIGGVHARELVNPDLLVTFALRLCQAYDAGTGLTFGPKTYGSITVKILVETLDIFVFPLVNPDGRAHVLSPIGDPWWRKNRNPNPGQPCMGVDLNRNYDFLWSSGIGTSASSCSDVFKGAGAFSEPETRNVRHLLDTYPNIMCMMDVHSYSELVLYPWGDDNNQTTDPSQNFMNAAYDGLRGTRGDIVYREYIPNSDLSEFVNAANRVRDAIAAVRGRAYTVQQSVMLYPTTGTSHDYAYARHFVDASQRRVLAYTLETATEFQPPYSEALNVIEEVSSGLVEFCSTCLCAVEDTPLSEALTVDMDDLRLFRDRVLMKSTGGRKYLALLDENTIEIIGLLGDDERLREQAVKIFERVARIVQSRQDRPPMRVDDNTINAVTRVLNRLARHASDSLQSAVKEIERDLKSFRGKSVLDGLKAVERARRPARKKASPRKRPSPG